MNIRNKIFRAVVFVATALLLLSSAAMAASSNTDMNRDGAALTYDIRVITYNVCGLPDFITSNRKLAPTDKRFSYIGKRLKDYDIIGLQEVFVKKKRIIENLLDGFHLARGTDTGETKVLGSGVYTFSRWPISKSHFEEWNFLEGSDQLSQKGFVAARTQVSKYLTIDVYNLHAQTGKDVRKKDNNTQLHEFMKYFSAGSGNPVILIGDFNCKLGKDICNHLIEITGVKTAMPDSDLVDHIFFLENNSGWKIEVVESKHSFTEKLDGKRTSDHTAEEAVLRFTKQ